MSKNENIILRVSDGTEMAAYVARSSLPKAPGVLVLQEAFGVDKHIRDVVDHFAKEGYNAIAPELFHRTAPRGWEGDYGNFDAIKPHYSALTQEMMLSDMRAAVEFLKKDPATRADRIGCIGFCLGGRATFLANSDISLQAAVSFYGGGIAADMLPLASKQHAPIMLFWGGEDAHIGYDQPRQVTDALRAAKKTFTEVMISDAGHGFLNDKKPSYSATASKHSWSLVQSFFETYLKGE